MVLCGLQALALSLGTSLEEVAAEGTTFSRKEKTKRSTRGSTPASLASAFEKLDDPPSPAGPSKVDRTPKQGKQKRVMLSHNRICSLYKLLRQSHCCFL